MPCVPRGRYLVETGFHLAAAMDSMPKREDDANLVEL